MRSYFELKEYMLKTYDFFDRKYMNDSASAICRTYTENVFGFHGMEYRLRLLFLNYAVAQKEIRMPVDLMEESSMNQNTLEMELDSFDFTLDEQHDLAFVMDDVSDYLLKLQTAL